VVRVWVGSRVLRRSSWGCSRILASCARRGGFFGVVRVVIRRMIVNIVSLQEEMIVGGLYYGFEKVEGGGRF
jgi:hypothetical protein